MGNFNFNKVIKAESYDDYLKKCDGKVHLVNIGDESFYDGTLVEYYIEDVSVAASVLEKTTDCNLKDILRDFIENKGKYIKDVAGNNGYWVGLELTHEDYYYVITDGNNIWCETCAGRIEIL